jgi:hypothetical protein
LQDLALLGVDLAARIAAGLEFGSLPLPRGPVVLACDESPPRFEDRMAEWQRYHGADRLHEIVCAPPPVGAAHALAHVVKQERPVAVIVIGRCPDFATAVGLGSLARAGGTPVLVASADRPKGAPVILALERGAGRSGQVTLQTAFGGRIVGSYSVTTSQPAGHGVPMLEMTAPESNTSPEPRKRPASAQAPIRALRDGRTPETAPATAASDLAT